jgi:regulator of protease activity HflC (stomatin/prohibitin superfamily)
MSQRDRNYFMRRAEEERAAAEHAPHPAAQQAHLALADRYAEIAEADGPTIKLQINGSQ